MTKRHRSDAELISTLAYYLQHANGGYHEVWLSERTLADFLGMSRDYARRLKKKLFQAGVFVETTPAKGLKTNRFHYIPPKDRKPLDRKKATRMIQKIQIDPD